MINIVYAMGQGGGTSEPSADAAGYALLIGFIITAIIICLIMDSIKKGTKPWENMEFRISSSQTISQTMERPRGWLKKIGPILMLKKTGPILIVFGIIAVLSSLNMGVSVRTGISGIRIANADLMNQRQNYVIVSSLILLIGVGITIVQNFIKSKPDHISQENIKVGTKKCPYCAEIIQEEARG